MGICWSCLTGRNQEEDDEPPLFNENTPLLRGEQGQGNQQQHQEEQMDRAKRDQTLDRIVSFTGENLIDVTSVSQHPNVRSVGKSASEYKRMLAELKFAGSSNSASSSPALSPKSATTSMKSRGNNNGSVLPKKASNPNLSDSDRTWLKELGQDASKAIKNEPVVKPSGELILTFSD